MAEIKFDIVAHADFSGQLRANKLCPGYAAFATEIDRIRRSNPEGMLFLDAGDNMNTNFWGGLPVVRSVALSGTDVMTLGNHEFDWGDISLEENLSHAPYPVLCANIHRKASGEPVRGTKPWVMLERQGVKIGVLGLTTEYTPYMVTAAAFAPYEASSCVLAANRYIPEMRAYGAEIVIVLAHIPFYIEADGGISGELAELLEQIPPVDVCMGGHNPGDYAAIVGGTAVMKGGFAGVSFCHARLYFDDAERRVVRKSAEVHLTDWNIEPLPEFRRFADEVTDPYRDFFEKPIAVTDRKWTMRLSVETPLGNFFAQCVQEAAGTDFSYMNATSCGGGIEPGTVTAQDITAVIHFNDPIMKTEMTGAQIWELFELVYVPERYGNNAGLMFSGVVLHIDHTMPACHKVQAITLPDGTPIDLEKTYTVASSEYMSSGGNDTSSLANRLSWQPAGMRMYDAIFGSIEKYGELHVSAGQRVYAVGTPENDNAPF